MCKRVHAKQPGQVSLAVFEVLCNVEATQDTDKQVIDE